MPINSTPVLQNIVFFNLEKKIIKFTKGKSGAIKIYQPDLEILFLQQKKYIFYINNIIYNSHYNWQLKCFMRYITL